MNYLTREVKSWTSISEQKDILCEKGLEDIDKYEPCLINVGYYRLSGYAHLFRDSNNSNNNSFQAGVKMRDIVELYEFDERLIHVLSKATRKLEICFRSDLGNVLGKADPAFYKNMDLHKQE
ncbi:MAG: Abi family protein [Micrococcaceae bacterium]